MIESWRFSATSHQRTVLRGSPPSWKMVFSLQGETRAMNEREQELLQRELDEYVDDWATSYREELAPQELDEQTVKEELQIFRSGLEGYTYGVLRGWRYHQMDGEDTDFTHSEVSLDKEDRGQIDELIERKMVVYMESLQETALNG
jgi:hypothetical protein